MPPPALEHLKIDDWKLKLSLTRLEIMRRNSKYGKAVDWMEKVSDEQYKG